MGAVVEHCGDWTLYFAECVLAHNNYGDSRGGEILLGSGVYQVVFGHIHGSGEYVAGHVRYQTHTHVGVFANFSAVNSVVCREMEIVAVGRHTEVLGYEREVGDLG